MAYVYKVRARYRSDKTGRELLIPAIITENGILLSHLRYLSSRYAKSQSWKERSVFALTLLIRFINANVGAFKDTQKLLEAFVQALTEGTIDIKRSVDPSGLYWSPRRLSDARSLLQHIVMYTDHLYEQNDLGQKRINPFRKANKVEERLNWCAYYHKKSNIFLNHIVGNEKERNKYVRKFYIRDDVAVNLSSHVRFPEDQIDNLMKIGFVRHHRSDAETKNHCSDYKNQAIAILLHYGGIRLSEALHLYTGDIILDPERMEAVVRIYHPSEGESPDAKYRTRKEFLAKRYGMKPRTDYMKSERLHCGWKGPTVTDKRRFFQVQFFPPEMSQEFLYVWANYLKYQRVDAPEDKHPYAFTNNSGEPETIKNFRRMHNDAVRRIGLEPKKYFGTTPHGHRHSYGYRLAEHGFSQLEIQKAMHHKSINSCITYIQPTENEIRERFSKTEV